MHRFFLLFSIDGFATIFLGLLLLVFLSKLLLMLLILWLLWSDRCYCCWRHHIAVLVCLAAVGVGIDDISVGVRFLLLTFLLMLLSTLVLLWVLLFSLHYVITTGWPPLLKFYRQYVYRKIRKFWCLVLMARCLRWDLGHANGFDDQ